MLQLLLFEYDPTYEHNWLYRRGVFDYDDMAMILIHIAIYGLSVLRCVSMCTRHRSRLQTVPSLPSRRNVDVQSSV